MRLLLWYCFAMYSTDSLPLYICMCACVHMCCVYFLMQNKMSNSLLMIYTHTKLWLKAMRL